MCSGLQRTNPTRQWEKKSHNLLLWQPQLWVKLLCLVPHVVDWHALSLWAYVQLQAEPLTEPGEVRVSLVPARPKRQHHWYGALPQRAWGLRALQSVSSGSTASFL